MIRIAGIIASAPQRGALRSFPNGHPIGHDIDLRIAAHRARMRIIESPDGGPGARSPPRSAAGSINL